MRWAKRCRTALLMVEGTCISSSCFSSISGFSLMLSGTNSSWLPSTMALISLSWSRVLRILSFTVSGKKMEGWNVSRQVIIACTCTCVHTHTHTRACTHTCAWTPTRTPSSSSILVSCIFNTILCSPAECALVTCDYEWVTVSFYGLICTSTEVVYLHTTLPLPVSARFNFY